MPYQARVLDITIGECLPCPQNDNKPSPPWLGFWITGSGNSITNNFGEIREYDLGVHVCTHCPPDCMHMAISGSWNDRLNNIDDHRHFDMCISLQLGGIGFTIRGSQNHRVNP